MVRVYDFIQSKKEGVYQVWQLERLNYKKGEVQHDHYMDTSGRLEVISNAVV